MPGGRRWPGQLRPHAQGSFAQVIDQVQPKIVKIFGAGGLRGLEAYQSGFLISGEGHILTVWSYVLDSDVVTIYLNDGRKFQAEVVGMDPRTEIAVLKIDGEGLPHFNLDEAVPLEAGSRVLAFSNLYGVAFGNEAASVLKGSVAAKTELAARRGAYETNYRGAAYVLDAMTNNPGAAGGALTDRRGRLAGLLGKELRSSLTNIWLDYAIPIARDRHARRGDHRRQVPPDAPRRKREKAQGGAHAGAPGNSPGARLPAQDAAVRRRGQARLAGRQGGRSSPTT